jgi:Heavy metal binding domain
VSGLTAHAAASPQAAKPTQPRGDIELPPLSYVCPMTGDEDVIEGDPGKCRKCGMELVPIRLDSVWTCATRPLLVVESKPGKCPVDGTPLIQVTAAVSWSCRDKPSVTANQPGTCPDGSTMIKQYAARAHGNHNPQHGGVFFMAPDAWHHLEGTYLPTGKFRLHLYDDYTKPLALNLLRDVSASVFVKDAKTGKEAAIPLVRSGRSLEAAIGKHAFPAQMFAKVRFKPGGPESRFDFGFEDFSKEPPKTPTPTMTTNAPASSGMPAPLPSPSGATATTELSSVDPALVPLPIPETVPEMLAQLRTRTDQIRAFIDKGSFASIYVPAFQAKDLALALDEHTRALPAERRRIAAPAITKLVRSAWLLDAFGDIGNKQQISEAYVKFVEAANDIHSSFPQQP